MFADRVFDHRFISGDNKGSARREYKKTYCFECFYSGIGKAAVQIIYENNQLFDSSLHEEIIEGFPECIDFLGYICWPASLLRLQQALHLVNGCMDIVLGGELCRIGKEFFQCANDSLNLVRSRDTRDSGEGKSACLLRDLEPVNSAENVFDGFPCFGEIGTFFDESSDDAFYQGDLGVLETLESPAIELEAQNFIFAFESSFDHLKHTGLASSPVTVYTDGYRLVRSISEQSNDRCSDGFVVQKINSGFVVGKYHFPMPLR